VHSIRMSVPAHGRNARQQLTRALDKRDRPKMGGSGAFRVFRPERCISNAERLRSQVPQLPKRSTKWQSNAERASVHTRVASVTRGPAPNTAAIIALERVQ
jgi:hypothetical protein